MKGQANSECLECPLLDHRVNCFSLIHLLHGKFEQIVADRIYIFIPPHSKKKGPPLFEVKEVLWTFIDVVTVTEGMHMTTCYAEVAAVTPERQKELTCR